MSRYTQERALHVALSQNSNLYLLVGGEVHKMGGTRDVVAKYCFEHSEGRGGWGGRGRRWKWGRYERGGKGNGVALVENVFDRPADGFDEGHGCQG